MKKIADFEISGPKKKTKIPENKIPEAKNTTKSSGMPVISGPKSKKQNAPVANTGFLSPSFAAVKEMQKSILRFAQVAGSTDVTSLKGNQEGRQYGDQSRALQGVESTQNDKEYLGGSNPFGEFIVDQYLKNDPVGKQYLNVDVAGKSNRQQAVNEIPDLRHLIDSINRIGTPGVGKGERSADGVWKYRTNNALKNIYALTKATFDFAKSISAEIKNYSEKDLEELKAAIPKEYTDLKPDEVSTRAQTLKTYIDKATDFFSTFNQAVLNNKNLKDYINQKKLFVKYDKEKSNKVENILGPEELNFYNKNQTANIPNLNLKSVFPNIPNNQNWISLSELENLDNFKAFLKRIGQDNTNTTEVKKSLESVSTLLASAGQK